MLNLYQTDTLWWLPELKFLSPFVAEKYEKIKAVINKELERRLIAVGKMDYLRRRVKSTRLHTYPRFS